MSAYAPAFVHPPRHIEDQTRVRTLIVHRCLAHSSADAKVAGSHEHGLGRLPR